MRAIRSWTLVSMLFAAATIGCGKKKESGGAGSASASDVASGTGAASGTAGSGTAGSGAASGTGTGAGTASGQPEVNTPAVDAAAPAAAAVDTANMAHKAGNCPSTVAGAATAVADSKDGKGVVLTISSKDKDAVWAIQTRAKHLAEVQNAPDTKVEHTGKGTGGGGLGVCPVVTHDTKIVVADTADGVTVTMTPTGTLKLDALKADVGERIKKSSTLIEETVKPDGQGKGGGGTGGGAGKHGGNRTGKGSGSGSAAKAP